MSTQTSNYYDIVSQLPPGAVVTFNDVTWEEYEELLERVGEDSGLRVSFDNGMLQVMTTSPEHEKYAGFIGRLVSTLGLRLRFNILFFGSMTMKKRTLRQGNEADGCFYVQTAAEIGHRIDIDLETDPPPDIAVEVDVHHDARPKFAIYAGLGVPEVWRYDGETLTIKLLDEGSLPRRGYEPRAAYAYGQRPDGFPAASASRRRTANAAGLRRMAPVAPALMTTSRSPCRSSGHHSLPG
jgi:Uma2 family endonuclease